ncbi:MAG: hypothetical protein AAB434_12640 [Planctomycetota bacterium]
MRRTILVAAFLAGVAAAQTVDFDSVKPPEGGGPNNTVGLAVVLEQTGGGEAVVIVAKGTAKLADGSLIDGFLKHKVNDSPLEPTQASVLGGSFEMKFGPYPGVYPGLYEVEAVFYPERALPEVQEALAKELGEDKWRSPSTARATIAIGGEADPVKQSAEAEAVSFEAIARLAKRIDEVDRHVTQAHQAGGLPDASWLDPVRQDLAKVDEASRKGGDLYGNPFVTEMNHRILACKAISTWMEAEVEFLTRGTLPAGVEGGTDEERRESAIGVFLSLREQAYGCLGAAKGSARMADCAAADVLADVTAASDARDAMAKALAAEKKGPSNATRYKEAVTAYRQEMSAITARNASALGVYAIRHGLSGDEERFKRAREELVKALEGVTASADAYGKASKGWQLSDEAKKAESEIDRALSSISSRLK